MKVVRIFTGPDNQSHFEDLEIPQKDVPFSGTVPGATDKRSDPIPVESARETAELLDAKFVELARCGHVPYVEQPEALFAELRGFL